MAEVGPNPQDEAARIAWLSQRIAFHSDLYYNQTQTQITDAEFDRLWDELKELDPNHTQLNIVGSDVDPGTVKVDHMFAMSSLDKATSDEEINHFVNETALGASRFISQPKLDGSALSLEYRKGLTNCDGRSSIEVPFAHFQKPFAGWLVAPIETI